MSNIHLSTIASSQKFVHFLEIVSAIPDPRLERRKTHPLNNIIVITVLAMLCGANSISAIARFGSLHKKDLQLLMDIPGKTPSRSTFNRALIFINPKDLNFWLNYWKDGFIEKSEFRHVAIDGKEDNANGFYCLRAFDVKNHDVFAYEQIPEKTNEITAAPKLLGNINLERTVVSADAMHAQKKSAKQIADCKGDYLFTLKGNQHQFFEDIKLYLDTIEENPDLKGTYTTYETLEKSRGRIEQRKCLSTGVISWLHNVHKWENLKSISKVTSSRTIKGVTTTEGRYYISSLESNASTIANLVRSHWSIENLCHRSLDIEFDSDRSNIRNTRSALNLSIFRDLAIFILKKVQSGMPLREQRFANNYQIEPLLKSLYL